MQKLVKTEDPDQDVGTNDRLHNRKYGEEINVKQEEEEEEERNGRGLQWQNGTMSIVAGSHEPTTPLPVRTLGRAITSAPIHPINCNMPKCSVGVRLLNSNFVTNFSILYQNIDNIYRLYHDLYN